MTISENRAAYILYNILKGVTGGRKWIIPANCCNVIPATYFKARVPFDVVDISNDTYCLDIDAVRTTLAGQPGEYAGVLFIYTYGAELDLRDKLSALKKDFPGVFLIEDKCLCRPSLAENGKSLSDVTMYSTGYAKYVDAGFGGYAFMKDLEKYSPQTEAYSEDDRIEMDIKTSRAVNRKKKVSPAIFCSHWLAMKGNPAGDHYFPQLNQLVTQSDHQKAHLNGIYRGVLDDAYCMTSVYSDWRFNILVNEPERLIKNIFAAELYASRHYCPVGNYIETIAESSPNADFLYRHVVNLFNDRYFSAYKAEVTARIVKKHVARYGHPQR